MASEDFVKELKEFINETLDNNRKMFALFETAKLTCVATLKDELKENSVRATISDSSPRDHSVKIVLDGNEYTKDQLSKKAVALSEMLHFIEVQKISLENDTALSFTANANFEKELNTDK